MGKRYLRVERGWQYALSVSENGDKALKDVFVYVMAWNTGRRPLHIEHAGWEFLVPGPRSLADEAGVELGPDNQVWVNQRVEVGLNGETFEVIPDGPSVKLWTRLGPLLGLGINPTSMAVRPYVVTVPEQYWWGSEGPLLPQPPPGLPVEKVERGLMDMARKQPDKRPQLGNLEVGYVHGVPRLILEGDIEKTSEVLNGGPDDAGTG
jgi:hypothetical protein